MPSWYTALSKEEQLDRIRESLPGNEAGGTGELTSPRVASNRSFTHALMMDNPAYLAQQRRIKGGKGCSCKETQE